jgi:hypothetical protein
MERVLQGQALPLTGRITLHGKSARRILSNTPSPEMGEGVFSFPESYYKATQ